VKWLFGVASLNLETVFECTLEVYISCLAIFGLKSNSNIVKKTQINKKVTSHDQL